MELHPQAKQLLELLQEQGAVPVAELERDRSHGAVMRPATWLAEKGLIEIQEEVADRPAVTEAGKDALENGLPEQQVLEMVAGGDNTVEHVRGLGDIAAAGIGKAKEKGLIQIEDGVLHLTDQGEELLDEEHDELAALQRVEEGETVDAEMLQLLQDRGLVRIEEQSEKTLHLTADGKQVDLNAVEEAFNVTAPTKNALIGRRHFAQTVYDYIRRIWVELGFREMDGPIVVPSLLNFDALFTPQDHPARELHDTFFLKTPKTADLSAYGSMVDWVKQTHEDGWETDSRGWQYRWSTDEAAKNVLRTHTTAVSAQTLWELSEDDLPAKYFSVGRNFRNETVTWKHIPEFVQSEGIVVGHDLSFQHLLGYLEAFFTKLGFDDIRFRPAYYPYTELSVEPDVYDDEKEEWVGMGGAGMFRPEVVKPLLGFEAPVLAWGLGPGRMVMKKHELSDIRDLYRNDLQLLRNTEGWFA